jgi:hypothetical protein
MEIPVRLGTTEEEEELEEYDSVFYEDIEAPKFVDLTAPDAARPSDDPSWFCLRVGKQITSPRRVCESAMQRHQIDPVLNLPQSARAQVATRGTSTSTRRPCTGASSCGSWRPGAPTSGCREPSAGETRGAPAADLNFVFFSRCSAGLISFGPTVPYIAT